MRRIVVTAAFLWAATAGAVLGAGYKVTRVIEVGPAVGLACGGAVKWSPDGTRVAYFANNYLLVSDTLGNSRQVAPISSGLYPMRAEWASDNEFAAHLADRERHDSAWNGLVLYGIGTGEESVVEEYWRTQWSHLPNHSQFSGPYLTVEGKAYYTRTVITGLAEGDPIEVLRSRHFDTQKLPLSSSKVAVQALLSDHLEVWGEDGLYLVDWSGGDSVRLSEDRANGALRMGTAVSADRSWIFRRGRLMNRMTPDTIDVASFAGVPPPNTEGCGFLSITFNPNGEELLFEHFCEGGETYVVNRIATFDYSTNEFTLLDTLTGIQGGTFPVYAPDGRMIAFFAQNKAYIIWREEIQ